MEVNPTKIYLASDGARDKIDENGISECDKVVEVREYLLSNMPKDCEVKTRFLEKNLGCKYAVSSAISWFFENEPYGIILEDDCLPHLSFFYYAKEMLERYKNDGRIFMISGWSALNERAKKYLKSDFYFSKYAHIWGWASYARAWEKYELQNPNFKNDFETMDFFDKNEKSHWLKIASETYSDKVDTWDFQWLISIMKNKGFCVYPKHNMIENIGFNLNIDEATHTIDDSPLAYLPTFRFPVNPKAPKKIALNNKIDKMNFYLVFQGEKKPHIFKLIERKCRNFIKKKILKID